MSTTTTSRLAESAAPLDVLLIDAALGPVRRFVPDTSTAKWAFSLARQPDITARRLGVLGVEAGRILTGTSTVAPHRGDRRSRDIGYGQSHCSLPNRLFAELTNNGTGAVRCSRAAGILGCLCGTRKARWPTVKANQLHAFNRVRAQRSGSDDGGYAGL